ncbi:MAG: chromate transporter [Oscillospiraceae bacterium]|nr:chromate transporter [Oscillospiraceae bacterium]
MIIWNCLELFLSFFKIGIAGFGGGYAMMSMILAESKNFGITLEQFADLNALDMIVPGPIAINSATYVGYLYSGFWGALAATLGVMLPSFIIVTVVMIFITRFRENRFISAFLSGVKAAAVGLVAAASLTIASGVLLNQGAETADIFTDPLKAVSFFLTGVFVVTAVANIRFKINPILLTVLAGFAGAVFLR